MQPAGLKEPFPHARHGGGLPGVSMGQNYPLLLVESLTKAQKPQEMAKFPSLLRLLPFFAAGPAIGFRALDKLA